jgi:hypothetical protein
MHIFYTEYNSWSRMKSERPAIRAGLLAAIMAIAVIANIDSRKSYFENDDFGTLNWARVTPFREYVADIPCLVYPCQHGRPVGYMFYRTLWPLAKLKYTRWALAMLAIGLINVALLWRLLTVLEFDAIASALGCLVFVAARALFDAWWKPMFIYDVLSTTFALVMLLAYIHRRWVVGFIALWLAMRTKEIGLMLPAVLLCYEFTLGRRNWKRLIPFFIPALIYGISGLRLNQHLPHSPYTMTWAPAALWISISFYASNLFGLPYAGLLLALALIVTRDKRLQFALGAIVFEIGMYLLLPHRMLDVYLYLAMTSVAIAVATLAMYHRRTVALLAIIWAAWQVTLIRKHAAVTIVDADDRRAFTTALHVVPRAPVYAYQDAPASFGYYGGEYAIRVITNTPSVYRLEDESLPVDRPLPLLTWDWRRRELDRSVFSADQAIYFNRSTKPAKWMGEWPLDFEGYRAVNGLVVARLFRPKSATAFEIEACGRAGVVLHTVLSDDELPRTAFDSPGCVTKSYPIPPAPSRLTTVSFNVEGENQVVRVGSFGFK